MNRRVVTLLVLAVLLGLFAAQPVKGDQPIVSLPTDTFVSFQANTVNQAVAICFTVPKSMSLATASATFWVDKQTGNLAGATAQVFLDSVSSGSPQGNNCSDSTNIANSGSIDLSQLPTIQVTCPCPTASVTGTFSSGQVQANQYVILGLKLTANPNGGTINYFGNSQTSTQMSDICFNGIPGCTGNFAVCNFVDNCIGFAFFGPPSQPLQSTVSPYGSNPATYPCCTPVTSGNLQGSALNTPDVTAFPLQVLFLILLLLTLGSYLIVRAATRKTGPSPRQYEIAL